MLARRTVLPLIALVATLVPAAAAHAGVPAYVVDRGDARVYVVDTTTGVKTELARDGLLDDPTGIAMEASGNLVVSDAGYQGVIRINRTTGAQQGLAQNTDFGTPEGISVAADGTILVADSGAGGLLTGILDGLLFNTGGVVGVDPADGTTHVVTADGNLDAPRGLAESGSDLVVADATGPGPSGSLITVDSAGGQSSLISGGVLDNPSGIVAEAGGTHLVTDAKGASAGSVYRVTGSAAAQIATGAPLADPRGIDVEAGGSAIVADPSAGKLIRVTTGGAQVPLAASFSQPISVAIAPDGDADGVADFDDNCPSAANAGQTDTDADGDGDACDLDDDNDGVSDSAEAWAGTDPLVTDTDGDAARDDVDNCPVLANAAQTDTDADGRGDACDADDDNDGVSDADEALAGTNPLVIDTDADGTNDAADNCPVLANSGQADNDLDLIGDACDPDDDNDGISDVDETRDGTNPLDADTDGDGVDDKTDNCPVAFNVGQPDTDNDGLGNACDPTPQGDKTPDPPGKGADNPGAAKNDTPAAAAPAFTPRLDATALAAEPVVPQPVIAKEVGVTPKSGTVKVRKPGTSEYVTLEGGEIPVGAVVDTTRGSVVLTSALPDGSVQSAAFYGGTFRVAQSSTGVTDLFLTGSVPGCPRASRQLKLGKVVAVAARHKKAKSAKSKKKTRLWGDGHGRFRTHGRNAVATVRGTKWLVEEQCSGTLVKVSRGVVAVRDKRTKKTKLVRKGEQLVAKR